MTNFGNIPVKKISIILLALLTVIYIYSLFTATVNGDEAALAEQAYWYSKVGFVKSTMLDGMGIGWENRQYHYHKLFILSGSLIYKVFGLSLYSFRLINYLFLGLLAFLIHTYIKKQRDGFEKYSAIICIIILLINNTLLEFGTIYRPETMVMTLGFGSFFFLSSGLNQNKIVYYYLAASLAGLSAFTHLNGLSFIFAGFILLVVNRKYAHSIGFGLVSVLFAALYFFDLTTSIELKNFWAQFTADPNLSSADFKLATPIFKIIDEQLRFFWNAEMITFSLFMIISIVLFFKLLKKSQFHLIIYFFALVIGLASVSHGKTLKYGLIYFPFMALIITFAIAHFKNLSPLKKKAFVLFAVAFLLVNSYSMIKNVMTYRNSIQRTEMISSFLPKKNVNILTSEYFFFNAIREYNIHIHLAFELKYEKYVKRQATVNEFYEFAESRNNQYIIFDSYTNNTALLELVEYDKMKEGQTFFHYSVIKRESDFAILELKKTDKND